ncbi:MAG TPA: DMT family transporter [Burkholderiales bacterium]
MSSIPSRNSAGLVRFFASPYTLLTLTALFWSLNWVMARGLREASGPMMIAFGRWMMAALLLAPFAWSHVRREWAQLREYWRVLAFLAVTGAGAYNALTYLGMQYTTAINGMLLNTLVPFIIMALSWAFVGEKLAWRQTLGICISFCGALWIVAHGEWQRLAHLDFNFGDLVVAFAMVLWSIYTIVLKRRPMKLHPLSFLAAVTFFGVLTLVPFALWESFSRPPVVTWPIFGAWIYMGLFPSIVCYLFWGKGVAAIGPTRAGPFLYLLPVFGAVASSLTLGENLFLYHVTGFVLILAGLIVSNRGAARETQGADV